MNFTENAKTKFWADLSAGIKSTFGHTLGEAFHINQYKSGRFTFTESVVGGPGTVTRLMDSLKASSPVIESVRMTPISNGYNSTYNVSITFDPVKAESVYSDGKNKVTSYEKDGKTYVRDDEGNEFEVNPGTSPDKFMDNLNKSSGSKFKKTAEAVDADGMPISLDEVISLANEALTDTGVSVTNENGVLTLHGDSALVKPTQQYLPEPSYNMDTIEGGYDEDTGDLVVSIPDYPSDVELEQLRSFLIAAVNYVIDNTLCKSDNCSDDEWCEAMAKAEPCESFVTQYGYKGDTFVGEDKNKVAVLVKSLLNENRTDEARKVATKFMGAEMAEGFTRKYAPTKVAEKHEVAITDEMALLDKMHEAATQRAPLKRVDADTQTLVEMNLTKEK